MQTKNAPSRELVGYVVSASMQKTIVVAVDTMKMHSKYQKNYRVTKKYHVHDEKGVAKAGDLVRFRECRPLSKTKCWLLSEIIKK